MARFLAGAMEAVWLLAAFLIPLAEAHQTWLLPRFDMPKVFALRTLALLLVVLWVSAWAVRLPGASARGTGDARGWLRPARGGLVVAAAAAVALASLFSFLVSPLRSVGLWGVDPGRDSGALFSIGAYLVFFAVLARRLRTRRQFRRLLWALTAASVIAGLRGVGQHFGWDPFMVDALPMERVQMGFGNPIPAAAYLIMTIPLTVALALQYGQRLSFLTHALAGAILICAQLAALLFTLSRGPWIGLLAGLALMLAAFGRTGGWRAVARPAAMLVIALALALALGRIPVPGTGPAQDALAQRLASVAPELTGKLSQRWAIWAPAAQVFLQSPWFEPG
ncbi:MAG: hypothetical protein IT514_04375, partial [Burkholderiales bacterium]|nr:hypothetical protein [Burkholderiales bacterium]